MEDTFQDPKETIEHAQAYLENVHGQKQAKSSWAWKILESAKEQIMKRCIDDLIGETLREKGIKCECPRHPKPGPLASTRSLTNGKMAAAGDRED